MSNRCLTHYLHEYEDAHAETLQLVGRLQQSGQRMQRDVQRLQQAVQRPHLTQSVLQRAQNIQESLDALTAPTSLEQPSTKLHSLPLIFL